MNWKKIFGVILIAGTVISGVPAQTISNSSKSIHNIFHKQQLAYDSVHKAANKLKLEEDEREATNFPQKQNSEKPISKSPKSVHNAFHKQQLAYDFAHKSAIKIKLEEDEREATNFSRKQDSEKPISLDKQSKNSSKSTKSSSSNKVRPNHRINPDEILTQYDEYPNRAMVELESGWGILNTSNNQLLVPAIYTWTYKASCGFQAKDTKGRHTLFTKDGRKLGTYDDVEDYFTDIIIVTQDGKKGAVNPATGKLIIPTVYDDYVISPYRIVMSKENSKGEYLTIYKYDGRKLVTKFFPKHEPVSKTEIWRWAKKYGVL